MLPRDTGQPDDRASRQPPANDLSRARVRLLLLALGASAIVCSGMGYLLNQRDGLLPGRQAARATGSPAQVALTPIESLPVTLHACPTEAFTVTPIISHNLWVILNNNPALRFRAIEVESFGLFSICEAALGPLPVVRPSSLQHDFTVTLIVDSLDDTPLLAEQVQHVLAGIEQVYGGDVPVSSGLGLETVHITVAFVALDGSQSSFDFACPGRAGVECPFDD